MLITMLKQLNLLLLAVKKLFNNLTVIGNRSLGGCPRTPKLRVQVPFRSLVPRLPAQTLQIYQKNILGISTICLWYFFEKSSILNKMSILGQAPRSADLR